MCQHTQKYYLDERTFTGTSAFVCQSVLKYKSAVVCKIDMLMDVCNAQTCALSLWDIPLQSWQRLLTALYTSRSCRLLLCTLFQTKPNMRPPTYVFCVTFCGGAGMDRNCQLVEGDLLNEICRVVSSTFCFCSFSPLYLKDCLEQIGS